MIQRIVRAMPPLARRPTVIRSPSTARSALQSLSPDEPIEEETFTNYESNHYFQAHPGDLLHKRYEIVSKLGYGRVSTVWLARDITRYFWQRPRYVALKIATADEHGFLSAERELQVSKRIMQHSSSSAIELLRPALDHFSVAGSAKQSHQCVVYKPLRETMSVFRQRWPDGKISIAFVRAYVIILLRALDFLHSECKVIHTDLKEDNILMTFEDDAVLEEYVENWAYGQTHGKTVNDRTTYRSQSNFGDLRSLQVLPQLTDYGLSEIVEGDCISRRAIQPPAYHAPEVLLGLPFSYSADIWNLGVLIWNLMEGEDLFQGLHTNGGVYRPRAHLAHMIALLGLPPTQLLDKEKQWRHVPYDERSIDGELITPCKSFGGPFFSTDGQFVFPALIPMDWTIAGAITALEGEEKNSFLDFIQRMLLWVPEERDSAKELLRHPWLIQKE